MKISSQEAVVVSMTPSQRDLNPTPRCRSSSTKSIKWRMERPRRSSRHTTSTSPAWSCLRHRSRPGRSAFAPDNRRHPSKLPSKQSSLKDLLLSSKKWQGNPSGWTSQASAPRRNPSTSSPKFLNLEVALTLRRLALEGLFDQLYRSLAAFANPWRHRFDVAHIAVIVNVVQNTPSPRVDAADVE
jgi:hypothetical protein